MKWKLILGLSLALLAAAVIHSTGSGPPGPARHASPPIVPLPACTETIGPTANLERVLYAAHASAVICLRSGAYRTGTRVSGITPSNPITIRPAPGAAVTFASSLALAGPLEHLTFTGFSAPSNLVAGVSIVGGAGTIAHLAFTYDNFDGSAAYGDGQVHLTNLPRHSDITFAHDRFIDISPCNGCAEGTIQVDDTGASNNPDGVTIESNLISGGLADGIQWGGTESGTRVLHNEITDKLQGFGSQCAPYRDGCPHTDALQFVGMSSDVVISGNFLQNNTDSILQADGSNTNITVTNNIFAAADSDLRGIQVSGWKGGLFAHNTLNSYATWDCTHIGLCTSGLRNIDNVFEKGFGNGDQTAGGQFSTEDYNLVSTACPATCGARDVTGNPVFETGPDPAIYLGWRLQATSPGVGDASDGTNRGANDFAVPPGP